MRKAIPALLLYANCALAQAPVALYTEEFPPYNMTQGARLSGISTDLVELLFRQTGIATSAPEVVPWARGLQLTATQPRTCLFTAARVPEREHLYTWVGPIARAEWALYARKKDQLKVRSLEDVRNMKIGTYIGDMSIAYLRERGFRVEAASSDKLNPAKLRAGRIDLWSVSRLPGAAILKSLGYEDMEVVLRFTAVDMYIACSPDMPPSDIARLNEGLRQLYQDGSVQRIYRRYGFEDAAPSLGSH